MTVSTAQTLPQFNAIKYQTKDGENITATKNNGIVTLVGDKNGIRQMPVEQFMKELPNEIPPLEAVPEKDEVTFKAKRVDEPPKKYIEEYKVEASKAKKFWVGFASLVCPGLGQAINGDWGRGILHNLAMWTSIIGGAGLTLLTLTFKKPLGIATAVASVAAFLTNGICSAVNAAKNATTKVRVEKNEA